jgi:hypothetical protein
MAERALADKRALSAVRADYLDGLLAASRRASGGGSPDGVAGPAGGCRRARARRLCCVDAGRSSGRLS